MLDGFSYMYIYNASPGVLLKAVSLIKMVIKLAGYNLTYVYVRKKGHGNHRVIIWYKCSFLAKQNIHFFRHHLGLVGAKSPLGRKWGS